MNDRCCYCEREIKTPITLLMCKDCYLKQEQETVALRAELARLRALYCGYRWKEEADVRGEGQP